MPRLLAGTGVERTDAAKNPGSAVSVATTSTLVAAANKDRVVLFVSNDGANTVYLRLGASAAVLGEGVRLPAGASLSLGAYTGEVRGIAATGATLVAVAEV